MKKKLPKPKKVKPNNLNQKNLRNSNWYIQVGKHFVDLGKPDQHMNLDKWAQREINRFKAKHPDWNKP